MDASDWAAVSATVAAIAAIASCVNVIIQRRSTDARDCLELVRQLAEAQRKANATKDDQERDREIRELLNLFETAALLFNRRRFGSASAYIARESLVDGWVWLSTTPGMSELVNDSITSATTFEQLIKFKRRYASRIADLAAKTLAEKQAS